MGGGCIAASLRRLWGQFTSCIDHDELVSQPTIEQCKLIGGFHNAICAMQYACANSIPLAQLSCPHCNFPVLDTEGDNTLATAKHVCKNAACAGEFRNRSKAFGNPLAAYKLENNRLIPN